MEERREMNGQRMMTREELEMRLPALNHIAEQRDAKFRLRYAEKTVNNGIERGYTLDAGTSISSTVRARLKVPLTMRNTDGLTPKVAKSPFLRTAISITVQTDLT